MAVLGYEFVWVSLGLQVFPVDRAAVVRPVTRIESRSDELAVPASVAPAGGDLVEHLLFPLKLPRVALCQAGALEKGRILPLSNQNGGVLSRYRR